MTPGICPKCGRPFKNQGALKMHVKACKGKTEKKESEGTFTEPPTTPAPDRRNAEHLPAVQPDGTTPDQTPPKNDKKPPGKGLKAFWDGIEKDLNA